MIAIGVGEFPINAIVFAIFGQGKIETYIIAALLCIGIPGMAHLSSKSIKQRYRNWVVIGIGNLSVLAALVGVSILREWRILGNTKYPPSGIHHYEAHEPGK